MLEQLDHSNFYPLDPPSKKKIATRVFSDYFVCHTDAFKEVKSRFEIERHPGAPNPAYNYMISVCINYHEMRGHTSTLDKKQD